MIDRLIHFSGLMGSKLHQKCVQRNISIESEKEIHVIQIVIYN